MATLYMLLCFDNGNESICVVHVFDCVCSFSWLKKLEEAKAVAEQPA